MRWYKCNFLIVFVCYLICNTGHTHTHTHTHTERERESFLVASSLVWSVSFLRWPNLSHLFLRWQWVWGCAHCSVRRLHAIPMRSRVLLLSFACGQLIWRWCIKCGKCIHLKLYSNLADILCALCWSILKPYNSNFAYILCALWWSIVTKLKMLLRKVFLECCCFFAW